MTPTMATPKTDRTPNLSASQSFSPDQVAVLEHFISHALSSRCGDLRVLSRTAAFAEVASKVQTMRQRVDEVRRMRLEITAEPEVPVAGLSQDYADPPEHG